MAKQMGKRAIAIGVGMGGMLFARVLADYFEGVTVLDRDSLPDNDEPRNGVPLPQRVLGFSPYGLSRPLLEQCIRRRVQAIANISREQNSAMDRE
jgi:hypothetical protein